MKKYQWNLRGCDVQHRLSGSGVVRHWKMKELDREDAQRKPGRIVLQMTWKVRPVSEWCTIWEQIQGELMGQPANRSSPVKMVCVSACVTATLNINYQQRLMVTLSSSLCCCSTRRQWCANRSSVCDNRSTFWNTFVFNIFQQAISVIWCQRLSICFTFPYKLHQVHLSNTDI